MIRELLRPNQIVLGLRGSLSEVIPQLVQRSSLSDRRVALEAAIPAEKLEEHTFFVSNIAIPHARIENLTAPELLLGISPSGVRLDRKRVNIVLLLATPMAQPAEHLQLLQRLTSLLPVVSQQLIKARSASEVLQIIAREEESPGHATYVNLTQEQVAFELQTDLTKGLTAREAARRLALHGPNRLLKARKTPRLVKLARNLFSFFAVLLWIAAALCFVPGVNMPELGLAIVAVIVVNGFFSFLQEARSDHAIEALQQLMSRKAHVIRDGQPDEIDAATLVAGDVIVLEEGDLVPADSRLVEAYEVEVDNSSLTGESTAAKRYKSDLPILIPGRFLWIELPNIVFSGTGMIRGRARAVVFGTGMGSEIGKIASLTQEIRAERSPLQEQLRRAVVIIAGLAGSLGLAFLLLGWLVGGLHFLTAFIFFIGIFVANVPEGLLPTVTLSLAMAVTRMARKNALVKNLPSVETLGCTTVICSDKTGTLTQNLMMVNRIYVDDRVIEVTGHGYQPEGEFQADGRTLSLDEIWQWPALRHLLQCAYTCNNARLERSGKDYRIVGDPTEAALIALAEKAHIRGSYQRLHWNPFESMRKRMSVVVKLEGRNEKRIYAKGAPLEILECCDRWLSRGEVIPLDEAARQRIRRQNDALADEGLRVLALTYRDDAELEGYDVSQAEKGLIFLGLAAMTDPIRPEVPESIRACHTAGIRILMITGDYALTAARIARQLGLGGDGPVQALTGAQISEMKDEELKRALAVGEPIFARVSPEHKLRLVSLLKEMGEIVAVTGDGVNDAPALKKADIGIAMGVRGNEVAKEAADMILTDDNFSTIVAAIEEGRAVFDNIRRFIAYILNSNPQEMYPYIFWMLFPGVPLAMTVMGVLAVDVGTDLVPAMGLGIEPPEAGVMKRPPRRREEKLLGLGFVLRCYFVQGSLLALSCYATYFYMGWVLGVWWPGAPASNMPQSPPELDMRRASAAYLQTLTAYFFPTVTTQIANVLSKRSSLSSIFSIDFLSAARRREILEGLGEWRVPRYAPRAQIGYHLHRFSLAELSRILVRLVREMALLSVRGVLMLLSELGGRFDRPLVSGARWLARLLEAHPVLLNFVSNPLILFGIGFELFFCWMLFYSPLSEMYLFAPVPWHVYLFAFHGTALLLAFEEGKKYFRRRGYKLTALN